MVGVGATNELVVDQFFGPSDFTARASLHADYDAVFLDNFEPLPTIPALQPAAFDFAAVNAQQQHQLQQHLQQQQQQQQAQLQFYQGQQPPPFLTAMPAQLGFPQNQHEDNEQQQQQHLLQHQVLVPQRISPVPQGYIVPTAPYIEPAVRKNNVITITDEPAAFGRFRYKVRARSIFTLIMRSRPASFVYSSFLRCISAERAPRDAAHRPAEPARDHAQPQHSQVRQRHDHHRLPAHAHRSVLRPFRGLRPTHARLMRVLPFPPFPTFPCAGTPHWHQLQGTTWINVSDRKICRYAFEDLSILMDKNSTRQDGQRNKVHPG